MGPPSASIPKTLGRFLALAPAGCCHSDPCKDKGHRSRHKLSLMERAQDTSHPPAAHQATSYSSNTSLTAPGQPGQKGVVYAEHWSERFPSREDELTQHLEAGPIAASKTPLSLASCKEQ